VSVAGQRALVMGASGNVGACATRHLAAGGADVRVLLRKSSSTKGIDGLDVERAYGDLTDSAAVAAAMADRDVVYYCVVDTRAELRDPEPLFKTNVEALRHVLDVAVRANLQRFVFLSTIGTIAIGLHGETVDEDTPFNWADQAGSYIESRRAAEQLVLSYVADHGLPAVVTNVSNPYGPPDWQPRQGMFVKLAAQGKLPFYVRGVGSEVVGIDDAGGSGSATSSRSATCPNANWLPSPRAPSALGRRGWGSRWRRCMASAGCPTRRERWWARIFR
jgi:dihydroflavonol-4-reductase